MESRELTALLPAADAAVLVLLRPDFSEGSRLAHPRAWLAASGTDQALASLAGAALWLVACWLAVGLLAALLARLPGAAGRVASASCRRLLPSTLRRLLAGSVGLGVLLGPVAASAHCLDQVTEVRSAVAAETPAPPLPAPMLPTAPPPVAPVLPTAPPPVVPLPAPGLPTATSPAGTSPTTADGSTASPTPAASRPPASPTRPVPVPMPSAPKLPVPADRNTGLPVEVRAGDSLWLIAARRLPAASSPQQIAAAWPRWYAANKNVIGRDPALILPGQVLHAPPTSEETAR